MPEQWRPVPGWEMYEVSNLGRVRRAGRLLRLRADGAGYLRVGLSDAPRRRVETVHRLVLLAFDGPCPDGMESRHLDGDPANNRRANLEWATHADNMADQYTHGTRARLNWSQCKRGHELAPRKDGRRYCPTCEALRKRRVADATLPPAL